MKCSFCGSNVPEGSELCPSCGMIISLGNDADSEITIPEYTPNVFGSEPIVAPAPVAESASVVPENTAETEIYEAPAYEEVPAESEVYEAPAYEEVPAEPEVYEAPAYEEVPAEPEVYEAPAYEKAPDEPVVYEAPVDVQAENAVEDVSYPEYEAFVEDEGEHAIVDDILNDDADADNDNYAAAVVVPVEEVSEASAATDDEDEYEEVEADNDDDTYIKSGKKGGLATIIALCLLLVCLVVAGGYIYNRIAPQRGTTTTEPSTSDSVNVNVNDNDDVTDETATDEEETSEENTTDKVTEESTTAPTTEDEQTTTVPSTTERSTAESSQTTTRVTTTKRQTTTKRTTTTRRPTTTKRPSTTKPSTTKPTTTDPYGINDVTLQKPSNYLSKTYHAYVNVSSVKMRAKPAQSAERVQYLEKGSEVIVYAKQNGFCYVWSTRFGTYGWISASYLSNSRPVESTTSVKKNTVSPDVKASGETKYTTDTLNLRKGPSTSHDVIKTVPINYPVKVIGYKSGVSGWAYVTDLTSGTYGWVSTAYLK